MCVSPLFFFKLCVTRLMSFNMNMEIIKEKQNLELEKRVEFLHACGVVIATHNILNSSS